MPLAPSAHAAGSHTPHPFISAAIKLGKMPGSSRPAEPVLHVGNNGRRYTHLKGNVSIPVAINAKVKRRHSIARWMVTRRDPAILDISQGALLNQFISGLANGKSYFAHRPTLTLSASNFVSVSESGGLAPTAAKHIVGLCNARFRRPPTSNQAIALRNYRVNVGFWSHTNGRVATASAAIPVRIICTARVNTPTVEPQFDSDPGAMKVTKVELFLTTHKGNTYAASPGATCPVLAVKTRIKTDQKGLVHYDIWEKLGSGSTRKIPMVLQARHKGNRVFVAEYTHIYRFNRSTYAQFMVQEKVNPIGLSTGWKRINIRCASGASGSLDGNSIPQEPPIPAARYSGSLNLASPKAKRRQCPRTGAVTAIIESNRSKDVRYAIDCTNGRSWQGTLKMSKAGPGRYRGVAVKTFSINKAQNMLCVLKRKYDNKAQVLAGRRARFLCGSVNFGGSGMTLNPSPTVEPTRILDPAVVSCKNGRIRRGKCHCRRRHRLVRIGVRSFRCVPRAHNASVRPSGRKPVRRLVRPGKQRSSFLQTQRGRPMLPAGRAR